MLKHPEEATKIHVYEIDEFVKNAVNFLKNIQPINLLENINIIENKIISGFLKVKLINFIESKNLDEIDSFDLVDYDLVESIGGDINEYMVQKNNFNKLKKRFYIKSVLYFRLKFSKAVYL